MATAGERFAELLDKQDYPMITSFKQTYIDALKQYYFIGCMPEAAQSFVEEKDFSCFFHFSQSLSSTVHRGFSRMVSQGKSLHMVQTRMPCFSTQSRV